MRHVCHHQDALSYTHRGVFRHIHDNVLFLALDLKKTVNWDILCPCPWPAVWPKQGTCPTEPQLPHGDQVLLLERPSGRMLVLGQHCARHLVGGPGTVAGPFLFLSQPALERKECRENGSSALGFRNSFYLGPRRAAKATLVGRWQA